MCEFWNFCIHALFGKRQLLLPKTPLNYCAHQQIELDLDDGVKVNYVRFQGVEVPKDGGRVETMDLLGKI